MSRKLTRREVLKGAAIGAAALAAPALADHYRSAPAHSSPSVSRQAIVPGIAGDGPGLPEGYTTRTYADALGITFAAQGDFLTVAPEVKPFLPVHFNTLIGNHMMKGIQPNRGDYRFNWTDFLWLWASNHGMRNHAHPFIWGSNAGYSSYTPDWVKALTSRDDAIAVLKDYVSTCMGRFPNITLWTIANETATPNGKDVWREKIGPDYPLIAARAARDANPNASLVLNDYANHVPGPRADQNLALASQMVSEGILDAMGFQMHIVGSKPPNPSDVRQTLSKFANLSNGRLKIRVTEMDVSLAGIKGTQEFRWGIEAQIYHDVLAALLEVGGDEFAIQGNSDALSWLNNLNPPNGGPDAEGTPFTAALALKPAYYALLDVLAKRAA